MKIHFTLILAIAFAGSTAWAAQPPAEGGAEKPNHEEKTEPVKRDKKTSKEIKAILRQERNDRARQINAELDKWIAISENTKEKQSSRDRAIAMLARAQNEEAMQALLRRISDPDVAIAESALNGIAIAALQSDENPGIKTFNQTKLIPALESQQRNDALWKGKKHGVLHGIAKALYSAGERKTVYRLASRLIQEGEFGILNSFLLWDDSVEPRRRIIDPSAKDLYLEAMKSEAPEAQRYYAAQRIALTPDRHLAVPTFSDLLARSAALDLRSKCLSALAEIGGNDAKNALLQIGKQDPLFQSTQNLLNDWKM